MQYNVFRFQTEVPRKVKLIEEIKEMREHIEALNMASVFSHNDILLNNIVINRKKGKVLFNKYEKVNLSFTIVAAVCSTQVNDLSLETDL